MSSEVVKGEHAHYDHAHTGGKKKGCMAHCKRKWWIYLIVAIIAIVVIVVLILFVAVPKIAQQKIDAAVMSVQGIRVTGTQSQKYTMAINSTITTDGSTHATIDAFKGKMYLEDLDASLPGGRDAPFAYLDFPEADTSALQIFNISQHSDITDMAAFTTFNTWLLANETLKITTEGETHVHVAGLSNAVKVTFKKTLEMAGLKKFEGTIVSNVNISITGFEDGTNMKGQATIPNRSLFAFEIGNASFINYLLDEEVGETFINNMFLEPGMNTFNMSAKVEQMPVLGALSEKPYCATGELPFLLRGKTVVNHGQSLSYYADSLASENQTVPINLTEAFTRLKLPPKCT